MPGISIWMIRFSLLWLILTIVTGSILLTNKAFGWSPAIWILLPAHIEAAMFGWVLQFTMGTAYWMFPRFLRTPKRGDPVCGWWMVVTLNAGILLTACSSVNPGLIFAGRTLMLTGVIIFIALAWNRVVSYRSKRGRQV